MRLILLMALVAGCGGDGAGAHDVIDCAANSGYPAGSKCERACAVGPACAAGDVSCHNTLPMCATALGACPSDKVSAFDGGYGCCADLLDDDKLNTPVFVACE